MTPDQILHLLSTQGLAVTQVIVFMFALSWIVKKITPVVTQWLELKRQRYEQELKDQHLEREQEREQIRQEREDDKHEIIDLKHEVRALRSDLDTYRREDVTKMMELLTKTNEALQKNNELITSNNEINNRSIRHMDEQSEIIKQLYEHNSLLVRRS